MSVPPLAEGIHDQPRLSLGEAVLAGGAQEIAPLLDQAPCQLRVPCAKRALRGGHGDREHALLLAFGDAIATRDERDLLRVRRPLAGIQGRGTIPGAGGWALLHVAPLMV